MLCMRAHLLPFLALCFSFPRGGCQESSLSLGFSICFLRPLQSLAPSAVRGAGGWSLGRMLLLDLM